MDVSQESDLFGAPGGAGCIDQSEAAARARAAETADSVVLFKFPLSFLHKRESKPH